MKNKAIAVLLGLLVLLSVLGVLAYSPNRTRIVKLCEKDTTTWECQEGIKDWEETQQGGRKAINYASGYMRYKEQGETFNAFLSTSGLDDIMDYQVTLNGQNGMPGNQELYEKALSDLNPYSGGCWAGGVNRRDVPDCDVAGGEGFYNIHMGTLGSLRSNRYVMHDSFDVELPLGEYEGIKLLVKQNSAPWNTYLYETEMLNFEII